MLTIFEVQDRALSASVSQKVETFSEGDLVYLFAPHTSNHQTGTIKFYQDCEDPLVINMVLDSTQ